MQATELQALARQPRRIAGARPQHPSIDRYARAAPSATAFGAGAFAAAAFALLLIADPGSLATQLAFYAAAALAGFLAGLGAACRWAARRDAAGRPWREGVVAGLVLAAATGLAFAGLRLGLGAYWPLPPALLLTILAVAQLRIRRP